MRFVQLARVLVVPTATPILSVNSGLRRVLRILSGGTGQASPMHARHDLTDEQGADVGLALLLGLRDLGTGQRFTVVHD